MRLNAPCIAFRFWILCMLRLPTHPLYMTISNVGGEGNAIVIGRAVPDVAPRDKVFDLFLVHYPVLNKERAPFVGLFVVDYPVLNKVLAPKAVLKYASFNRPDSANE